MPTYRVIWEIDIDADSPQEAAASALATQRNPESIATVFTVHEAERWRKRWTIDYADGVAITETA